LNLKTELLNCVKDLYRSGLNTAMSGNHSVRFERDWMWITPSEVPRYKMKITDLIKVNIKTKAIIGKHKPSREWFMHSYVYQNTEANAIVHCHSPYSSIIALNVLYHKIQQFMGTVIQIFCHAHQILSLYPVPKTYCCQNHHP